MLAPAHAITSALGYLVVVNPFLAQSGDTQGIPQTLAGCMIAAGAGLLADLDHRNATATRALPPITNVMGRVIETVSGGHRNGTHSLLAVAGIWISTHWIVQHWGVWPLTILLAVLVALALQALFPRMREQNRMLWTGAILLAMFLFVPGFAWLPLAITIGYAMHIVGDMLTKQGVPPLWPVPMRVGFGFFATGKMTESVVRYSAWAATCCLLVVTCILPLARTAHPGLLENQKLRPTKSVALKAPTTGGQSSRTNAHSKPEAADNWEPPQTEQRAD